MVHQNNNSYHRLGSTHHSACVTHAGIQGLHPAIGNANSKYRPYLERSLFVKPMRTPYKTCLFLVPLALLKFVRNERSLKSRPSDNKRGLPRLAPIVTCSSESFGVSSTEICALQTSHEQRSLLARETLSCIEKRHLSSRTRWHIWQSYIFLLPCR